MPWGSLRLYALSLAMAAAVLRRYPQRSLPLLRSFSTESSSVIRSYSPPPPHDFAQPCDFLGSWTPPPSNDPREAGAKLARLRRDYKSQVKQLRREYIYEMELLRAERQRKADAKREAARISNEERKATKAKAAESRAAERKVFEEEFRQMLLKERAEKLENWRAKEELRERKKNEKKALLHQQSSLWIAEENLDRRILEAIVDTTPLY